MRRLGYHVVGLALAAGLVLSACAAPQKPAPAAQAAPAASPAPAAPQLSREQKLIEGAKKEGQVVFWVTSLSEPEKLISLFQARYPFLKLTIYDGRDTELIAKLAEEAKIGRHTPDVLLGSPMLAQIHNIGLLAEYDFPNVVGWPGQPKHKYYRAPYFTVRVVAYNTDLVSPAEVPKSWDDVKSTKWAGKTFASNSSYDAPLYWAYLWRENDKLNWDRSFAFWGEVIRNTRPRVVSGFSGPIERLAAGEAALFVPGSTSGTFRIFVKGAPVGPAPLLAPGTTIAIALAKDGPHPNAARLLLDWLTTPEGLLAYADPSMFLVVAPQLQDKARANRIFRTFGASFDLVPDDILTEENLKKSTDFWLKGLGLR